MEARISLLSLLLAGSCASAADWEVIGASEEFKSGAKPDIVLEMDMSSIALNKGYRTVWTRFNYSEPQNNRERGYLYKSAVLHSLIDCKTKETGTLRYLEYEQMLGKGAVLFDSQMSKEQALKKMSVPVPDTYGQSTLNAACAAKVK